MSSLNPCFANRLAIRDPNPCLCVVAFHRRLAKDVADFFFHTPSVTSCSGTQLVANVVFDVSYDKLGHRAPPDITISYTSTHVQRLLELRQFLGGIDEATRFYGVNHRPSSKYRAFYNTDPEISYLRTAPAAPLSRAQNTPVAPASTNQSLQ